MADQFPDATKMVPTLSDRIALAVCPCRSSGASPCKTPCDGCRRDSAAVVRELAEQSGSAKHWHVDQLIALAADLDGGASTTADPLDGVGSHQHAPSAGWPAIDPGKEAMALAIGRELRRPDV
jgi:hypothetical protein